MAHHELRLAFVDMDTLVKDICQEIKEHQDKHIEFTIHDLPPVAGETALLRQVWSNLIGNAVKYSSKKDNPVVEIGSEVKSGEIVYYVKDNGAGFNMKYYDKLFGIFQRLHNKKDFEGTGIGLATVQKILIRHKGKIWAESVLDEGSVFYFSMPIKEIE